MTGLAAAVLDDSALPIATARSAAALARQAQTMAAALNAYYTARIGVHIEDTPEVARDFAVWLDHVADTLTTVLGTRTEPMDLDVSSWRLLFDLDLTPAHAVVIYQRANP